MAISDVLASIDQDIARLQQARALLADGSATVTRKKAGRPKKVAAAATKKAGPIAVAVAKPAKKKKRNLSPEGRKRIAEAVKRRWEVQKKAAAAK